MGLREDPTIKEGAHGLEGETGTKQGDQCCDRRKMGLRSPGDLSHPRVWVGAAKEGFLKEVLALKYRGKSEVCE